jgi:hypothetical protein
LVSVLLTIIASMTKTTPDHHDAELLLRVYDLRREAVLRESRRAILREFWPRSLEDLRAVLETQHPLNAAYRQVGSYWEMVYSFVRYGIVHPAFWLETNGEGLYLFAKVEPFLEELRKLSGPTAFRNAEWVARECPDGTPVYERIKSRLAKLAAARGA